MAESEDEALVVRLVEGLCTELAATRAGENAA
jgi:hypothetical protein